MSRLYLVVGGCRSGKSRFATDRAMAFTKRYYLATGQSFDQEMDQRISRHRQERGDQFITCEEPFHPTQVLAGLPEGAAVVVDCLTLWISNLLLAEYDDQAILQRVEELLATLAPLKLTVFLVSNEVGLGIVPEHQLARRFRDLAGWVHQLIAPEAQEVFQMSLGIALPIKSISRRFIDDDN